MVCVETQSAEVEEVRMIGEIRALVVWSAPGVSDVGHIKK